MAWVIGAQKYSRQHSFNTAQLRLVQGCKNILAFSDAFGLDATPRVFALPMGQAAFLGTALSKFGDNVDELLDFLRDSFDVDERLRLRKAVLAQYGVEEVRNNAVFKQGSDVLRAGPQGIPANREVFVSYGRDYWQGEVRKKKA